MKLRNTSVGKMARVAGVSTMLAAGFVSCVTVNVTFPEAAVQQATDDYVDGLYREKEKGRAQPSPKPDTKKQAQLETLYTPLIEWLMPSAEAAASNSGELKISVTSPKAMEIRKRQVDRLAKISQAAAQLGESNMGLLSLDHDGKLTAAQKTALQPLVDAENGDRRALYNEILSANSYPASRLIDLQKSFARSFQTHAPAGMWVQDDGGKWLQKP